MLKTKIAGHIKYINKEIDHKAKKQKKNKTKKQNKISI